MGGYGGDHYTTAWSYGGSVVAPQDTWLYTRVIFNDTAKTYRSILSTGNYDNAGGVVFAESPGWDISSQQWADLIETGRVVVGFWDNYGGTASWMLVGEVKYDSQGTCSNNLVKFNSGTPAKATDVNANFDALNCQIQALKAIICQDHPAADICK